MASSALDRALRGEAGLRPLPEEVDGLLRRLDAPPRLGAHLRAVHDVACRLLDALYERFPGVDVDQEAVRYGAATHDVGKTYVTAELSGPGSEHERRGHRLLLDHGVEERLARFARTHGSWDGPDVTFEDLLVSLADKVWKGKRVPHLEQRVVDHLATAVGQEPWEVFMTLDDLLTELAADADRRLAFQSAHPITS
ncbi:HD domain-containing protein [Actinoallomurus iriomotensis]|uniref:HD domain-containing protein n=1 Tax=Actinoallomurus iriomotensis TaxID=478107 RepID=UPI002553D61D|nr:HD domain-containing protein [Actinoallomurus iriomotensis]